MLGVGMVVMRVRPASAEAQAEQGREHRQAEHVEEQLVVDLDRAEHVRAAGSRARRDEAERAEHEVHH